MAGVNIAWLACIPESLFVLLVQLLHPLLILLQCACKDKMPFTKNKNGWNLALQFYAVSNSN